MVLSCKTRKINHAKISAFTVWHLRLTCYDICGNYDICGWRVMTFEGIMTFAVDVLWHLREFWHLRFTCYDICGHFDISGRFWHLRALQPPNTLTIFQTWVWGILTHGRPLWQASEQKKKKKKKKNSQRGVFDLPPPPLAVPRTRLADIPELYRERQRLVFLGERSHGTSRCVGASAGPKSWEKQKENKIRTRDRNNLNNNSCQTPKIYFSWYMTFSQFNHSNTL